MSRRPSKVVPLLNAAILIVGTMLVFALFCEKGYFFGKKKKTSTKAQFKKFDLPENLWKANESLTEVR